MKTLTFNIEGGIVLKNNNDILIMSDEDLKCLKEALEKTRKIWAKIEKKIETENIKESKKVA